MSPVVNLNSISPQVWIPPVYTANYKITIERIDGTVDDITDLCSEVDIVDGVTDGIGTFSFKFPNPNETYTGVYTGMEIFRFYCDYIQGTPTTVRFLGRIEKPSYKDNWVACSGRGEAIFVSDLTVTKSFQATDIADIVRSLFSTYGGGRFTTVNVPTSTGFTLTVDWRQKSFLECMKDICTASGYNWYIDASRDVHLFEVGSQINADEAIVHDHNLVEVGEFAADNSFVKNRIIVYGANQNGIQLLYTAEDLVSQSLYGIRELTIQDDNLTSFQQCKDLADYTLSEQKNPPVVGEITGILIATIQPGDSILLSAPYDGLYPSRYETIKYNHKIDENGLTTTVTINKEPRKLSNVLRNRIEAENRKTDTSVNTAEYRYSMVFTFDSPDGTFVNAEINSGILTTIVGSNSGIWTSPSRDTTVNVTEVFVVLDAKNPQGLLVEVSGNNGVSYQEITPNLATPLTSSIGNNLIVKITINESTSEVDGVSVLYKT